MYLCNKKPNDHLHLERLNRRENGKKILLIQGLLFLALRICASGYDYQVRSYDFWNRYPSQYLREKAYDFLSMPEKRDSALVCYTILVNRLDEGRDSREDIENAVVAMDNLSSMYVTFYYDYRKGYELLLRSRRLAEQYHITESIPFIYLGLANIRQMMSDKGIDNLQTLRPFQQAFHEAVKYKSWSVCTTSFLDMIEYALITGKPRDIGKECDELTRLLKTVKMENAASTLAVCQAVRALMNHQPLTAATFFEKGASLQSKQLQKDRMQLTLRIYEAMALRQGGDLKGSRDLLETLRQTAQKTDNVDFLGRIYRQLSLCYGALGDKDKQQYFELLYYKDWEKTMEEGKVAQLGDVKLMNDINLVNEKVQSLKRIRYWQNILLLITLAVVVFISFLLYRLYRANKRTERSRYRLYLKNEELMRSEDEMLKACDAKDREIEALRAHARKEVNETKPKSQPSNGETKDSELLYTKILQVLRENPVVFSQGFTVNDLAALVGSTYHKVSQVINEEYGNNFKTLVNEYRVKEACRRLVDDEHYGNMTIEGIAESIGFRSRTNFIMVFKKVTGLTPSEYKRMSESPVE